MTQRSTPLQPTCCCRCASILITSVQNIEKSVCRPYKERDGSTEGPRTDDRLLNKLEAIDYLRITESTYYRWIARKILDPRGEPGNDHFYESELLEVKARKRYRDRL